MHDDGVHQVLRAVGIALFAAAVADAVARRRQHGETLGFVPYDFRMPTMRRLRGRVWDPDAESVLSPAVFGVGWTLNVGRLARLVGLV